MISIRDLHPYIWRPYPGAEYATLVFARNRNEAKLLGFREDPGWHTGYIDCRVNRLPRMAHLIRQMRKREPHVIDDPVSCDFCGRWSADGKCDCDEADGIYG